MRSQPLVEDLRLLLVWRAAAGAGPISRPELADLLRCSDRALRRAVAEARERGIPVCAAPGGGYYLGVSARDVRAQHRQLVLRIRALARAARRLERYMKTGPFVGQAILELTEASGDE